MAITWDNAEATAAGLDVVHEDHRPRLHAEPEAADVRLPLTLQALLVPGPARVPGVSGACGWVVWLGGVCVGCDGGREAGEK